MSHVSMMFSGRSARSGPVYEDLAPESGIGPTGAVLALMLAVDVGSALATLLALG